MVDMGIYFEPPRKQAKRKWAVIELLAENGYKFQTEGAKVFIEKFVLGAKNPGFLQVKETIEAENQARIKRKQQERTTFNRKDKGKI